jgi:hypothetical protein
LARLEFEPGIVSFYFFYLCFVGESRLLVSWCAGGRCDMACSDKDCGRSRRPSAEVGYSVAERSRGQVTSCEVCTVHVKTRSAGFLVEP